MNDEQQKPIIDLRKDEFHRKGTIPKPPADIFDAIALIIGIAAFFIIKIYYFDAIKAWLFGT